MKPRVLISWSTGKDSAWMLHRLRREDRFEIIGLATTINERFGRAAMHGTRLELAEAQARAAGLPLWPIPLPWPCSNDQYEERMRGLVERARSGGVTALAFGDLFLQDIRDYRIRQLAGSGIEPIFPLWGAPDETPALAREMLDEGLRAVLACIDPKQLSPDFAGRAFDERLFRDLPPSVDPCGERGEFHTFCHDGPMFDHPIPIRIGQTIERDGFFYTEIMHGI